MSTCIVQVNIELLLLFICKLGKKTTYGKSCIQVRVMLEQCDQSLRSDGYFGLSLIKCSPKSCFNRHAHIYQY